MGNCVSASHLPKSAGLYITVLLASEGKLVKVQVPPESSSMQVGELLLEFPPGHFVTQFNQADFQVLPSSITISKRASPMPADADVPPNGHVYVLFPMPRLHTRIASQELLSFSKLLHHHHQLNVARSASKLETPAAHRLAMRLQCLRASMTATKVAPVMEEEATLHENRPFEQAASCLMLLQDAMERDAQMKLIVSDHNVGMNQTPLRMGSMSDDHNMQVGRCKPWVPKLETIKESGHA